MKAHTADAFLNEDSGNEEPDLSHAGNYSSHMEELFDEEAEGHFHGGDPYEDEDGFIYSGVDVVDAPTGYQEQLLDVLGNEDDGSESDVLEVENSLVYDQHTGDEPLQHVDDVFSEDSPSNSSSRPLTPLLRISSPDSKASYFKLARPFLHPTVSRLRSYTPQATRNVDGSVASSHSHLFDGASPSPSHFSSISRVSSASNLQTTPSARQDDASNGETSREVFRWTELQAIMQTIYTKLSPKASGLLGASSLGRPTVLAANGLICTGTDDGKVVVHDFNQTLICICESNVQGNSVGAVTAVALSHDHTFVVSGHVTGHIILYNLKNPRNPVRCVPPTTLTAVSTGRKEGHLQGSKIINVGFVAGRHTAIISADNHGLAFFHSLGKILFVEASDILRILGRYPDSFFPRTPLLSSSIPAFSPTVNTSQRRKTHYTILAMSSLPLGTAPHATDNYHAVALLTPTKLVVIGLKPSPKTWFKCPREVDEGGSWRSRSKWIGSLAWFPCVIRSSQSRLEVVQPEVSQNQNDFLTTPMLAYSWGSSLHIVKVAESRIKQVVKNPTTGKATQVEIGTLIYERFGQWLADDDIIGVQWLNANQIIVVTRGHLGVYDLKVSRLVDRITLKGLSLASPTAHATDKLLDADNDPVAHSVRVYKGNVFLLERDRLVVGTLLTWADRVLSLVQDGNLLGAIDLVHSYYIDEAPGNRNNLPDDPNLRKQMIGEKLRSLMDASTQYTFSEDRMTDSTHITPDNRGVDRTSLFEGLVTVCCRACVALDDFEFLFENLFQRYDDSGISSIYLQQLEPFILSNEIRHVPPQITQKLVALHEKDGRPDHVERIIWHMDPSCLDLNQAIHICQQYHLYDALIYIYTRAMRDYVAPVVMLLGLIRQVRQYRRSVKTAGEARADCDPTIEAIIISAYKIYPYLANVLSGLTYPSEDPLTLEDAFHAKKEVYTFLFFGRSRVWPEGEGGRLILTSDEEGGVEPTYPYVRQLLLFDSESFLHSLDIAFEDAYFNDEFLTINRLMIARILLEILSSGSLLQEDATLVNIFIARNVPKYPQFIELAPTALHSILIRLAEDPDPKTREDRQFATEYLLSNYNPHDSERVTELFESAGFFRILRAWYHRDHQWARLLSTYIHDPDSTSLGLLDKIEEVIHMSSRTNKGVLPNELIIIVSDSLPRLLDADIAGTAALIDRLLPELHSQALEIFDTNFDADKDRHEYLQSLLRPNEEEGGHTWQKTGHGHNVPQSLQQLFIALQCRFNPTEVIPTLQYLVKGTLDLSEVLETCESNEVYDAVVWAINWQGDPQRALMKADTAQRRISLKILETFNLDPCSPSIARELDLLQAIAKISRDICLERSQGSSIEVPLEDMWFKLLNSQIHCVQIISASMPNYQSSDASAKYQVKVEHLLSSLRFLVQTTFSTLVTVTSTSAVSFPRLFKRLVNSTPQSTGSHYNEFRIILTGMLESYRSDEDILIMLKHLVDRDLFEIVVQATRERTSGWVSRGGTCQYCRKSLAPWNVVRGPANVSIHQIIVSRTGAIYHRNCNPPDALL